MNQTEISIDFLQRIIREAGALALSFRERLSTLRTEVKDSDADIVTEADRAIEERLRENILDRHPDHGILGEEGGETGESEYRWVIDPIDGTTGFAHGLSHFSVSIALEKNNQPLLAGVYAPALGELFLAEHKKGASFNGKKIHVSKRNELSKCVLSTGFACIRAKQERNNLKHFCEMMPRIRGIRRLGSAALDLCYVAAGILDGYWELNLQPYDIAAGKLILQEAGGIISDYSGSVKKIPAEVVASNELIHAEMLKVLSLPG